MQEYTVSPEDVGKRVDIFITGKYAQFARSALSILFNKNLVLLNSRPAKPGDKLREGDIVSIDESTLFAEPEEIELPILFEDENVMVIDKPAGTLTHSKGGINTEGTVASFIKHRLNDKDLDGNRAGIVHRLDRGTSGVIITAKNTKTQNFLQKQFSLRKVKKVYLAIVEGCPKEKEAIIDAPIERNPKRPQTFRVGSNGKPAQTHYKVLKQFTKGDNNYSLLELKPVTGRTHQLRVHLSYIGHPIVGDVVYGHPGDHILLHAKTLEITLPGGERKVFESKEPKKLK